MVHPKLFLIFVSVLAVWYQTPYLELNQYLELKMKERDLTTMLSTDIFAK